MFNIREANIEDCSLIREIASQVWAPTYGDILSEKQLEYMFEMMYSKESLERQMTELCHRFFIVYHNDTPSGYLSIETVSENLYNFQKIYSLPSLHGSGIGRFIIEQGIDYLKSINSNNFIVELYVNRENPAVGFYQHLGFKIHDTRDKLIGDNFYMNDYIMRYSL